jgi:hypothetical protein
MNKLPDFVKTGLQNELLLKNSINTKRRAYFFIVVLSQTDLVEIPFPEEALGYFFCQFGRSHAIGLVDFRKQTRASTTMRILAQGFNVSAEKIQLYGLTSSLKVKTFMESVESSFDLRTLAFIPAGNRFSRPILKSQRGRSGGASDQNIVNTSKPAEKLVEAEELASVNRKRFRSASAECNSDESFPSLQAQVEALQHAVTERDSVISNLRRVLSSVVGMTRRSVEIMESSLDETMFCLK